MRRLLILLLALVSLLLTPAATLAQTEATPDLPPGNLVAWEAMTCVANERRGSHNEHDTEQVWFLGIEWDDDDGAETALADLVASTLAGSATEWTPLEGDNDLAELVDHHELHRAETEGGEQVVLAAQDGRYLSLWIAFGKRDQDFALLDIALTFFETPRAYRELVPDEDQLPTYLLVDDEASGEGE